MLQFFFFVSAWFPPTFAINKFVASRWIRVESLLIVFSDEKKNGFEFTIKFFMPSYYIRTEFTFSCNIPTCVRVPILYKYKHILHCIYLHISIIQPAASKSYNIMIYDELLILLKECHITFFIYNYYYIQTNQTVLYTIIFFIISIRL